jgi:hypothetical protein
MKKVLLETWGRPFCLAGQFPLFWFLFVAALPVWAQANRDFLSENEIEKVREVQEPNERLKLYILFARQRMDQVTQQLAKDKKGRSLEIRTLLDDYEKIIEAIDRVSDDALKRKADITLGLGAVSEAEHKFVSQLEKIKDSSPRDLDMFSIELTEALATTKDSLDLAGESVVSRTDKVTAAADEEKKEVESITKMEREATGEKVNPKTDPANVNAPAGGRRKPPTLMREGEKPDDPSKPATPVKPPPH